ncbi:MAG: endolytic transglycosylase MltG [Bacteroidales bacterium]|nr:endolytic transglycosylase MltG [Bacteroidales bacterium]
MEYYHSKYGSGSRRKSRRNVMRRFFLLSFMLIIAVAFVAGLYLHRIVYGPNTWVSGGGSTWLHVPTGSDFSDLKNLLYSQGMVLHRKRFEWLAERKNLPRHIHPGRYEITTGMSSNELINMLRSGEQTPVMLVFNNIRTRNEFAQRISRQIEADSLSIVSLLNDAALADSLGLNTENILTLFIPNTYEVYWTTDALGFISRMAREHKAFWNAERRALAAGIGLAPAEAAILASIVEKETNRVDEMPAIAGVYLNRMRSGWLLQADPTVVFAWGDFSIHRVLNLHKKIESPYNTYIHRGLPPGPVCIPSVAAIDAVLHADQHDYFFFCARDDFSGYHDFARTLGEHNRNARRYQQALDRLNIRK